MIEKVENYRAPSGEFRLDNVGTLCSTGASDPTPDDINTQNEQFWQDRLRGTRDSGHRITRVTPTPEGINAANKRFYGQ